MEPIKARCYTCSSTNISLIEDHEPDSPYIGLVIRGWQYQLERCGGADEQQPQEARRWPWTRWLVAVLTIILAPREDDSGSRLHREVAQNSGSKGRERHRWLDDDEAAPGRWQVRQERQCWLARQHGGCSAHCLLCEKTAAPVGSEDSWGGGGEDFGMGIGDLRVAWVGKWGMGERIFRSHNVLMDGRMEPRWRDRTVHAYAGTVTLQQRIAALWFTGSGL
ncbi:hypothetical protein OsJ_14320 [Oryza sativa Japonica Group]|uniref:Uncharacterized protein n=1 Tax=Oryza sativa subsp. japonica TaxID=39947 RepID=A3ASI3_ORYSJ|nr:hypothetical protein OsJ_14320 [Oryza sativa Japonica Group]